MTHFGIAAFLIEGCCYHAMLMNGADWIMPAVAEYKAIFFTVAFPLYYAKIISVVG